MRRGMLRTPLAILFLSAAVQAADGRAPPRMVSNVYLLAQAGAMLDVCSASPEAPSFPAEKSRDIAAVADRLTKLVASIAAHYGDSGLPAVYSATKAQIASDTKLKFHVLMPTPTKSRTSGRSPPIGSVPSSKLSTSSTRRSGLRMNSGGRFTPRPSARART